MPPARKIRRLNESQSDATVDQKKTRSGHGSSSPASAKRDVKSPKSPRWAVTETGISPSSKTGKGIPRSANVEKTAEELRSKPSKGGTGNFQTSDTPVRGSPRTSGRISKPTPKVAAQLKSPATEKNKLEKKGNVGHRIPARSAKCTTKDTLDAKTKGTPLSTRENITSSSDKAETNENDRSSEKTSPTDVATPRSRGRPRKLPNSKPLDSTSIETSSKGNTPSEVPKDKTEEENSPEETSSADNVDKSKDHEPTFTSKNVTAVKPNPEEKDTSGVQELAKGDNSNGSQEEDMEIAINAGNAEIEDKTKAAKESIPTKKRQGKDDQQQQPAKKSKHIVESEVISPRKSSRQRKLSRWFEDMEVEIGRKKPSEPKPKKKIMQKTARTSSIGASVSGEGTKDSSKGDKAANEKATVRENPPEVLAKKTSTIALPFQSSLDKGLDAQSPPTKVAPTQTTKRSPGKSSPLPPPNSTDESTQADIPESEGDEFELSSQALTDTVEKSDTTEDTQNITQNKASPIIRLVLKEPLPAPSQASDKAKKSEQEKEESREKPTPQIVIRVAPQDKPDEAKPDEAIPDTYRGLTYTSVVMPAEETCSSDTQEVVSTDEQAGDDPNKAPQKKQEFVIVRLPEGVAIQQETVSTRKPVEEDGGVQCSVNEVDGTLKCLDCNYITNKRPNWYKHKKMHMGVKPYVCDICQYRASTSSNLKRHVNIHKDVRAHNCDRCGLTFRQKIHLERHIKYKHEVKSIQCPLCDYVCANENPDLKIHIKRRHQRPPEMNQEGGFTCDECGLVAISRRDYKQHMKFHRRGPELKLFCEHCSFVTDCESRMNRHLMIHTKVKPFQCGLCEYRGTQKEHVMRHMKSQHNIDMPEKGVTRLQRERDGSTEAALAAMGVSEEDSLSNPPTPGGTDVDKKGDKADFSSRDKIFACNHCTMKFAKLINLYKHLHTQHRAIMPTNLEEYSCVVCEFRTNSKKNLLVHMRKHNLLDQSPPSHVYSCVLCSYVNPKRRNLFQHMKKKHKIEIVMKDDGSANCFIAENSNLAGGSGEVSNENLMTVGDVVTASTSDTQLQVVTENGASGSVQRLVSISDLTNAITLPQNNDGVVYIDNGSGSKAVTQMDLADLQVESINVQHEAAEAIQGLQALAEQSQRHILETPINVSIDQLRGSVTDSQVALAEQVELTEPVLTEQAEEEVSTHVLEVSQPITPIGSECAVAGTVTEDESSTGEERPSIQLSSDQLMNLSSGDYVEINGEMYKVEFTTEEAAI